MAQVAREHPTYFDWLAKRPHKIALLPGYEAALAEYRNNAPFDHDFRPNGDLFDDLKRDMERDTAYTQQGIARVGKEQQGHFKSMSALQRAQHDSLTKGQQQLARQQKQHSQSLAEGQQQVTQGIHRLDENAASRQQHSDQLVTTLSEQARRDKEALDKRIVGETEIIVSKQEMMEANIIARVIAIVEGSDIKTAERLTAMTKLWDGIATSQRDKGVQEAQSLSLSTTKKYIDELFKQDGHANTLHAQHLKEEEEKKHQAIKERDDLRKEQEKYQHALEDAYKQLDAIPGSEAMKTILSKLMKDGARSEGSGL